VSDLHLGGRLRHDVLTRPEALKRLLDGLDSVQRLVLLGDVVELLEGRPQHALDVAGPVLRAIGGRLGSEGQVVIVPGNHDAALVRPWIRAQSSELAVDTSIPFDATPVLARVVSSLAPARVCVRYPGVWLSDRVWATHGHYLDRHLLPESSFGIARGLLGRPPRDGASPIDYELAGEPSFTRVETLLVRWLPRPLAGVVENLADLSRAATMPKLPAQLLPHGIAPLTARLLGLQMRRASLPALARVVHRLGVDADWVLCGHTHRLGPTQADDLAQWRGPGGSPRIVSAGSWVYEPRLLHRASPPHPYWPGGAIVLEDGDDPRALGLLDDLAAPALR
jgi:UDP-2,3-diacylglucosamine pyrophosphatase LpxH